eukprot:Rmarinus@m.7453
MVQWLCDFFKKTKMNVPVATLTGNPEIPYSCTARAKRAATSPATHVLLHPRYRPVQDGMWAATGCSNGTVTACNNACVMGHNSLFSTCCAGGFLPVSLFIIVIISIYFNSHFVFSVFLHWLNGKRKELPSRRNRNFRVPCVFSSFFLLLVDFLIIIIIIIIYLISSLVNSS